MENEQDRSVSKKGPTVPQYSHAGHGQQSLGHSVVPDLMKIYESLTQSKTPQTQQQTTEQQYQPPPPPPPPQQVYSNATHFYPPPPAPYNPYHPQQFAYATQQLQDMPGPHYPAADNEEVKEVSSSGRTLRKRQVVEDDRSSDGSTSRSRKKKKSDGRWSKRFTWPDDLHRDFVSAIFDVGLKHASPSALLEHMPEHDQITSERLKSHLQKYRLHRGKSKKEFMSCYEASLSSYQSSGIKGKSLGSGEVAAHLAYSTMTEPEETEPPAPIPVNGQSDNGQDSAHEMIGTSRGGALVLPKLTEAEKQSPIGASMGYMMGLFFALRQQLMANRAAAAASGGADVDPSTGHLPLVSYPNSTDAEHGDHEGFHDHTAASWPPPSNHGMDPPQSHVSYQDQTSSMTASNAQASASRSNLEESNMMKREMQNQMAFQNKMRALKQQELNKTKLTNDGDERHARSDDETDADNRGRTKNDEGASKDGNDDETAFNENGESAGDGHGSGNTSRSRQRGVSMGASDEFWVNDDQLFEFLMNT